MSNRRTVIIVAAVTLAALAALATWQYTSSVTDRANKGAALVTYYVAARDIDRGLPAERALSEGYIKKSTIPKKNFPAKAVLDPKSLQGKVAVGPIAAGLPIVDGAFADARSAIVSFSGRIPKGMQAVTISVDQVKGVAGLIVPGDHVNLLATLDAGPSATTQVVLQHVQVLAVGQSAEQQPGEVAPAAANGKNAPAAQPAQNATSGLLTFAVPATEASKIVEASVIGQIYLTLLPPYYTNAPVPVINRGNLFS